MFQVLRNVCKTSQPAREVQCRSHETPGEETDAFADSGYRGVEKREEVQAESPM